MRAEEILKDTLDYCDRRAREIQESFFDFGYDRSNVRRDGERDAYQDIADRIRKELENCDPPRG